MIVTTISNRLPLPAWQELRDAVLVTLVGEREPIHRYELVERTVAAGRWPRQLREQLPLATNPTHLTHLAEGVDATIGRMYRDKLLERPGRGRYLLSAHGRSEARKLSGKVPHYRPRTSPLAQPAGGHASPAAIGSLGPTAPPAWATNMPIGHWKPFAPIRPSPTQAPSPFTWDAEDKDAQTQEHADVLNRLFAVLAKAGVDAVKGTTRPACDLAFRTNDILTIVEAKSLPKGSDEHQMRVGIGQVIEYRAELAELVEGRINAILAVPRAPARARVWRRACDAADVTLLVVGPATRGLRQVVLGLTESSRSSG